VGGISGGLVQVLRRILVIALEDSAPLQGMNPVLVWFLGAVGARYAPTERDVAWVLGAVDAVARCPAGPTKNVLKPRSTYLEAVPPVGVLDTSFEFLCVVPFGGLGPWDSELFLKAAEKFVPPERLAPMQNFAPIPPASLRRLRPEEFLLEAVDTEVGAYGKTRAPIWDAMFEIEPDLENESFSELQSWMCGKRSMVQVRYNFGEANARRVQPDWHGVADAAARRIIDACVVSNPPW